jgi:hypothetical protein
MRRTLNLCLVIAAAGCGGDGMTDSPDGGSRPTDAGPTEPERWEEVHVGAASCARTNHGRIRCWGELDRVMVDADPFPPDLRFTSFSVGFADAVCGITPEQTLICSGGIDPRAPSGLTGVRQVDLGGFHGCAILSDGSATCWGRNTDGEAEPPGGTFSRVSVGVKYSAGLTDQGELLGWGKFPFHERVGEGPFRDLVVSAAQILCVLRETDGQLRCAGPNSRRAPTATVARVFDSGSNGTCVELEAGREVVCWASLNPGERRIEEVPPGVRFHTVSSSAQSACGITDERELVCWGNEANGNFDIPSLPLP